MKTIEDFKKAGLEISEHDTIDGVTGNKESCGISIGEVRRAGEVRGAWTIREFAWREATCEKPLFNGMIEAKMAVGDPVVFNIENLTFNDWALVNSWRPLLNQSIPTETPEEKEELDRIFGKASGDVNSDQSTNEAPVYTQEMYDNGDLPDVGMMVMAPMDILGDKLMVGEVVHIGQNMGKETCVIQCQNWITKNTFKHIKPIDVRTDKEKLFDEVNSIPRIHLKDVDDFVNKIVSGKITGVKWVGK